MLPLDSATQRFGGMPRARARRFSGCDVRPETIVIVEYFRSATARFPRAKRGGGLLCVAARFEVTPADRSVAGLRRLDPFGRLRRAPRDRAVLSKDFEASGTLSEES